jgi:hypothetical protein
MSNNYVIAGNTNIMRGEDPLNLETPFETLDGFITRAPKL